MEKKLEDLIYKACLYAAVEMGSKLKKGSWFLSQWTLHEKRKQK